MMVALIKAVKLDTDTHTHTHTGRVPCEDKDRNWEEESASQGMPKTTSKLPSGGTSLADTLIFNLQPQNIKQKQYCNKLNKDFKNGPHQKKKKLLKR